MATSSGTNNVAQAVISSQWHAITEWAGRTVQGLLGKSGPLHATIGAHGASVHGVVASVRALPPGEALGVIAIAGVVIYMVLSTLTRVLSGLIRVAIIVAVIGAAYLVLAHRA